jgi:hypothetical protein
MFAPGKHFQPYLLFAIKAVTEPSLSGALLLFNVPGFPGANAQAYFISSLVTKKKVL